MNPDKPEFVISGKTMDPKLVEAVKAKAESQDITVSRYVINTLKKDVGMA